MAIPRSRTPGAARIRSLTTGIVCAALLIAGFGLPAAATSPVDPASATSPAGPVTAAGADGWVVSLGDSFISGEGGRWAGNSEDSEWRVDAGGQNAYSDPAAAAIDKWGQKCHRSTAALVHVGGGQQTLNLACSGAETRTTGSRKNGDFKPGIDFADTADGKGQLTLLKQFAANHTVDTVVLSIGGNDFQFSGVIKTCVLAFLPFWKATPCSKQNDVTKLFSPTGVAATTKNISDAIVRLRTALNDSGQGSAAIIVSTYPNPIPPATETRTKETYIDRLYNNGCPFLNTDMTWAAGTVAPTVSNAVRQAVIDSQVSGIRVLNMDPVVAGHRLCAKNVNTLSNLGKTWTTPGAWDLSEWMTQIRLTSTVGTNYEVQESMHPNWWAERAMRNCFRQMLDPAAGAAAWCSQDPARSFDAALGEPVMRLTSVKPTALAAPAAAAADRSAPPVAASSEVLARGEVRTIPRLIYPVQTGPDAISLTAYKSTVSAFRPLAMYPSSSDSGNVLAYIAEDGTPSNPVRPVVRILIGGVPRINLPATGIPQVTADGRFVVISDGSRVLAFDTVTSRLRTLCANCGSGLMTAALAPDRATVALASTIPLHAEQLLTIRRLSDGALLAATRFQPTGDHALAWDRNSRKVAFSAQLVSNDGTGSVIKFLRRDGRLLPTALHRSGFSYQSPRWFDGSLWAIRLTDAEVRDPNAGAPGNAVRVASAGGVGVPSLRGPVDRVLTGVEGDLLRQATWTR